MRRQRQKKPLVSLIIRILLVITASVLVGLLFFVPGKSWDGNSRLTVILQTGSIQNSDIALISVEPQQKRGVYILIRKNIMMDIPYGYRTYPANSVYKLGQLDNARGGGKLLKSSIETTLGIKTDRYINLKIKEISKLPDSEIPFSEFKKGYFSLYNGMRMLVFLIKDADTDMKLIEKIRFFNAVKNLKLSEIKVLDLSKSQAAVEAMQPDNSKIFYIDSEVFDHIFADDFQNIDVRREEYTLEVQNATGKEKIAGQFARILNTLGAYVILKTNAAKETETGCRVYVNSQKVKSSAIAAILTDDYRCKLYDSIDKSLVRSDILVIIGKDFLK